MEDDFHATEEPADLMRSSFSFMGLCVPAETRIVDCASETPKAFSLS